MDIPPDDSKSRSRFQRLLFFNLLAVLFCLGILVVFIPIIAAMFADFGAKTPAPLLGATAVANVLNAYYHLGGILTMVALFYAFSRLRRISNPSKILVICLRLHLGLFCVILLPLLSALMFMPVHRM